MATKKIDASKVVWLPPELLDRAQGEFREVQEPEIVGAVDGVHPGASVPSYGAHVQWVDDAPDDPEDGSGHFEVYDGSPDDYTPTRKAD